jgi:predicted ATPase with chaperone activity
LEGPTVISSLEAPAETTPVPETEGEFVPREPASLAAAGLSNSVIEALVLKLLLTSGVLTGRQIAEALRLPLTVLGDLLRRLKIEQVVVYKSSSAMHDYEYDLTETGFERARRLFEQSSYFGPAPVPWSDYVASVAAQSVTRRPPKAADLSRALEGLQISARMFSQLGAAISSVGAVFLFGAPGNGKTSIAERITAAFSPTIWIPRVINAEGEFMQLFDPLVHVEIPSESIDKDERADRRWVRIKRPTIIAGGELTLESLEIGRRTTSGLVEAPLHMKSNCGTLVLDDFGRQRVSTVDLLNRWIVPLEKRYDFLSTPCGRKLQVPFDQMIVFATNLEPKHLVDEAFLRRIPYKIEASDPSENEFRRLFQILAERHGIACREEVLDYLLEHHYRRINRPLRYCHPRDLILQVYNHCKFAEQEAVLTNEAIDVAVANYFVNV